MAKAKRARRNSIRTMETDASALEALEALERTEPPAEASGDREEPQGRPATATAEDDRD